MHFGLRPGGGDACSGRKAKDYRVLFDLADFNTRPHLWAASSLERPSGGVRKQAANPPTLLVIPWRAAYGMSMESHYQR